MWSRCGTQLRFRSLIHFLLMISRGPLLKRLDNTISQSGFPLFSSPPLPPSPPWSPYPDLRSIKVLPDLNVVATASWDKTVLLWFSVPFLTLHKVRLWDTRQPNPAATLPLSDRAFCMDAGGPGMVVCTGDRKIHVFDLTAGDSSQQPSRLTSPSGHNFNKIIEYESPMAVYQTRCVSVFNDKYSSFPGDLPLTSSLSFQSWICCWVH